ncbi:MAG: glycine/sarcosine/betaine reductase complex component C subunit alpha [Bacillota bacterium]|nr:glycine/sarcosine/betaine reductase complex component C subunit alpha [Bacillota bacterium]
MDKKKIAHSIMNIADSLESGVLKDNIKIAVTNFGSELGVDNVNDAILMAKSPLFDIVVVGTPLEGFESYEACGDDQVAKVLEDLFNRGEIQAAVTMHYPFPIGVSTVGKIITPAFGNEIYLATTTGTTHAKREKAMILNAINGIIVAKANGVENPTLGILNIEGAVTVEKKLRQLKENGFDINFASSKRSDGGSLLRGNDLVAGVPHILVCDSLTGNVLVKTFASYNSGGFYETTGYGYGPSVGQNYDKAVFIVSRASGAPVIRNAISYAYDSVKGGLVDISKSCYEAARKANLDEILASLDEKASDNQVLAPMPEKEIVTQAIGGIDILEIENAVQALWAEKIYAESAMGCTGPMVMVSDGNIEKAKEILENKGYI